MYDYDEMPDWNDPLEQPVSAMDEEVIRLTNVLARVMATRSQIHQGKVHGEEINNEQVLIRDLLLKDFKETIDYAIRTTGSIEPLLELLRVVPVNGTYEIMVVGEDGKLH